LNKKVIIVGGGIAGLSAGIYAQKCGFDVTIFESHSIPGGICTSWKRSGYLFEGGMHWLAGSNPNEPMNKLWLYVGAVDDSVNIRYSEPFMEYDHEGMPIRLYRDVDASEKPLLELSPADSKEIKIFCNNIRKLKNLSGSIADIKGVKTTRKSKTSLSDLFSLLPAVRVMVKYSKLSREKYASQFKHEGIREMLLAIPGANQGMAMLFMTMGSLARGDGGFPEGGSLPFASRMANKFISLGGKILYKTKVSQVIVEGGKATGVITECEKIYAEAVIIASDTMAADRLFAEPLNAPWINEMRKITDPTMVTFVSLGINADLRKYNGYYLFKLKKPISLSNMVYDYLAISNYAADSTYSPPGKSVITVQLPGDTYNFWEKHMADNTYIQEKQRIGDAIKEAIESQMPEAIGNIEVCDVATPLTYERYCGNWKGSWMTEIKPDMKFKPYPAAIKGLDGVYFAGQRMIPPGGIPAALMSGRRAVQYLCRDTDTVFISE